MHVNWKHLAMALAVLPFTAVLVAWIGFFNVGASSGHWKITEWFLHFAMRSAVRTYALAVEVPDELPHHAIQPAAGHFARGCAICHGAPGEPQSPAVDLMLPRPPHLADKIDEWTDAELFRIVKHGVRFTGMPAWPVQTRDDEVWAMVAFLRELPAMEEGTYRDLAYGHGGSPTFNPTDLDRVLAECSRCHRENGRGHSSATPVLSGQSEVYLLESLRAYADGRRPSGIMALPVAVVDPDSLARLARHFATQPSHTPAGISRDLALVRRGEDIARSGVPRAKVPACIGCHRGRDRNPLYPTLAGQHIDYIEGQLKLFREATRGGTKFNHLMANAAKGLSDADIAALAAYFSGTESSVATRRQ
jgi:cytochrome c553